MRPQCREDLVRYYLSEAGRNRLIAASLKEQSQGDPAVRERLERFLAAESKYRNLADRIRDCDDEALRWHIRNIDLQAW